MSGPAYRHNLTKMVKVGRKYGKKRFQKKTRARTRSATGSSKRFKSTKNRSMVSTGLGFPKKMKMTHKYHENITLTAGATLGTYSFACNGMYDPNITGVGHQPYYYDQMSALYDHYHVIGAKITVKFIPTTASAPMLCGVFINDDSTVTPTNIDTLCENSNARWRTTDLAGDIVTFNIKWSAKKAFGGAVMANNSLQGEVGSNPTELQTFQVFLQHVDKVTNVSANLEVAIQYIAIWHELKDIIGS